jgi:molybdopterin-guanine dinucleotide biosynthesis protein A
VRRSGVILAGGRSSRIGRTKALIPLGGEPLLVRVGRRLQPLCDELVVVAAPRDALGADADGFHACLEALRRPAPGAPSAVPEVVLAHDGAAYQGPASGLYAGLSAARGALAFAAGCDAPFLLPALVERFFSLIDETSCDLVIPRFPDDRFQPLVAAYRVSTMAPHFARQLAAGVRKPTAWIDRLAVRVVEADEVRALDPNEASFRNVNTEADLDAAEALLAGSGSERG